MTSSPMDEFTAALDELGDGDCSAASAVGCRLELMRELERQTAGPLLSRASIRCVEDALWQR
jgi:hypothetical protein